MTYSPEDVRNMIEAKGTKFATVTFLKKDGSERTINGLFRPLSKFVGSDRGIAQGEAMKDRGQVYIWENASKAPKSFFVDRVVDFK